MIFLVSQLSEVGVLKPLLLLFFDNNGDGDNGVVGDNAGGDVFC